MSKYVTFQSTTETVYTFKKEMFLGYRTGFEDYYYTLYFGLITVDVPKTEFERIKNELLE